MANHVQFHFLESGDPKVCEAILRDLPDWFGIEDSTQAYIEIKEYMSFYPGRVSCYINEEHVRPQPGGFYGGWVTNEIVGPYKGETGRGGW